MECDGAVPWVLSSVHRSRGLGVQNWIRHRLGHPFIYLSTIYRAGVFVVVEQEKHAPLGRIAQLGGLPIPTGR